MSETFSALVAGDENGWFVVWTASRAERKVETRLAAMGMEVWLPTVTEKRRRSDRWRDLVYATLSWLLVRQVGSRKPAAALPDIWRRNCYE